MSPNLAFGWIWILVGFVSGMLIGLRFHDERWLGGYGSHPRRMIRLGHVSFLGLGFVNILWALSAPHMRLGAPWMSLAAATLVVGAVTMPLCCGLMAWRPALKPLFAVPVASLLVGAALAAVALVQP